MIRIVKMSFAPERIESFVETFETIKANILDRTGCNSLQLVQAKKDRGTFFTISVWTDEEALNAYRESELFKNTWQKIKPWFKENAKAWSTDQLFSSI